MFGFFDDPFDEYEYVPRRNGRNYDPFKINGFKRYMKDIDQTINHMFENDEEDNKESKEVKENQKGNKENKKVERAKYWSKSSIKSSIISSQSEGGIEEIREKTYDSKTGETKESQTRRIGDRWCRIDKKTDKKGVSQSKETWHNVSDDEMEKFKKEWLSRREINFKNQKAIKDTKETAAIKIDDKEEKKEENNN